MLEDGRTYATELVQSRKPGEGYVAQWEHELVSAAYSFAKNSFLARCPSWKIGYMVVTRGIPLCTDSGSEGYRSYAATESPRNWDTIVGLSSMIQ